MKSHCKIFGHPLHPILVSIPIGLWSFSLGADILYLVGGNQHWPIVSAYCIAGGCIGAILAALPGMIDYFFLKEGRVKQIATWHMGINLCLVGLYTINFFLRHLYEYNVRGIPFILSVGGFIFLGISGWLGGELIYKHRVAVEEEDNLVPTTKRRSI